MASISLTVPDALVARVLAALKANHPDVDVDGLGQAAAAKRIIAAVLRSELAAYEARQALEAGWAAAGAAEAAAKATASADSTDLA